MGRPVTDLVAELGRAPVADELHRQAVLQRAARTLRPPGALGRLDPLAGWLAAWQRTDVPAVTRPALVLAAGDHGVAHAGIPTTAAMVDAIRAGVATPAVMAELLGVTLRLVDAAVGDPTGDSVEAGALSSERFVSLIDAGRRTARELDADLIAVGELGSGNPTATAAVAACLYGGDPGSFVGGADEESRGPALQAVRAAVERVGRSSPLETLRRVGGAEHAVVVGVLAEARIRSIPVLLDGYGTAVAAAVLAETLPGSVDHCLAAHLSTEAGHGAVLDRLGMTPLLDLRLGLGDGSGALVALPLVRLAAAAVVDVATFEEWGME